MLCPTCSQLEVWRDAAHSRPTARCCAPPAHSSRCGETLLTADPRHDVVPHLLTARGVERRCSQPTHGTMLCPTCSQLEVWRDAAHSRPTARCCAPPVHSSRCGETLLTAGAEHGRRSRAHVASRTALISRAAEGTP